MLISPSRPSRSRRLCKHILRAAEYLRDLVLREVFTLRHIPGVDNPADVMTKALPRGTFLKIVDLIYRFEDRRLAISANHAE